MERPRFGRVREELLLDAGAPLQPVVDRVRRDRRGQRSEVVRRRAGDAGELLEAPVRQLRASAPPTRSSRTSASAADGSHVQVHGLGDPLFGAAAPGAGRVEELLQRWRTARRVAAWPIRDGRCTQSTVDTLWPCMMGAPF